MKREELLYKITGTETPQFVNERENVIIDKCLEIINEKEQEEILLSNIKSLNEVFIKGTKLKEHTLYKILVKVSPNNVEHESFLFTGFESGSYCMIYNNSYEHPISLKDIYSFKVLQELTQLNTNG
jgi:hypothetical protein